MAAKKEWTEAELLGKNNEELFLIQQEGGITSDVFLMVLNKRAKIAEDALAVAKKSQAVNITEVRIGKDGMIYGCPGKPLSAFQTVCYLKNAAKIVALMRAEFDSAKGAVVERIDDTRKFGGTKDEKVKTTRYLVGSLLVASNNAAHVETVRQFLAT